MNIPAGFAQINCFLVGSALPRNAQVVFGVENTEDMNAAAVAAAAGAAFVAGPLQQMCETVTLEKVKAKLGPNDTGPEATVAFGDPGGLTGEEAMSPNVSILVNKLTDIGGKSNSGKFFIPGFSEEATTGGGYLTPTALDDWETAMGLLFSTLASGDVPLVVLHTNELATPTAVTSLSVQQRLATQKRRIRRAGGRRTPTP